MEGREGWCAVKVSSVKEGARETLQDRKRAGRDGPSRHSPHHRAVMEQREALRRKALNNRQNGFTTGDITAAAVGDQGRP